MALETAFYKVTKEIAVRSGVIDGRYRTLDGFFILDNKDLSRIRFTPDEYINGLEGIEKISETEAQSLIAKGGFKMGLGEEEPIVEEQQQEEVVEQAPSTQEEVVEEPTEETEENQDESEESVDEEPQNEEETQEETNENQEEE